MTGRKPIKERRFESPELMTPHRAILLAALFTILPFGAACRTTPMPRGSVMIQTAAGAEQGVNTPYGVVFLGRTAREGPCEVVTFFGDGPAIEPARIRAISEQLYKAETELKIPACEISYTYPMPGDDLLIALVNGRETHFYKTDVAAGVSGTAVEAPSGFPRSAEAAGAPVFRREDGRYRLIGLVNGVVRFGEGGARREVFTFTGPRDLVALAIHDHDFGKPKVQAHREDILR